MINKVFGIGDTLCLFKPDSTEIENESVIEDIGMYHGNDGNHHLMIKFKGDKNPDLWILIETLLKTGDMCVKKNIELGVRFRKSKLKKETK